MTPGRHSQKERIEGYDVLFLPWIERNPDSSVSQMRTAFFETGEGPTNKDTLAAVLGLLESQGKVSWKPGQRGSKLYKTTYDSDPEF